jgi:precorrin-6x reductase
MKKVLIFAGTEEGRMLAGFLAKHHTAVTICIATEYAEQLLFPSEYLTVMRDRLDARQMCGLMSSDHFCCVIDATHPYASEATENIIHAAKESNLRYYRVIRDSCEDDSVVRVASYEEAADYLSKTEGIALIVTGSKRADAFTAIPDYPKRCYLRILPVADGLQHCIHLGFLPKNMICMQGPFTEELNVAMIRQIDARYLVTKDSGKIGGVDEKLTAAKKTGATVVMIGRPKEETGFSLSEMEETLSAMLGQNSDFDVSKSSESRK